MATADAPELTADAAGAWRSALGEAEKVAL